jgi:hypothetical protein
MALKRAGVFYWSLGQVLSSFTTDSPRQLDVFGHNSHSLGVDSTQVGVFKQTNKVSFACFL